MINRVALGNGYYLFKLSKLLSDRHISINRLTRDTNTDFKVVKRMMNGELVRIDIVVLARLCDYFDCELNDLIEYHCNEKHADVCV